MAIKIVQPPGKGFPGKIPVMLIISYQQTPLKLDQANFSEAVVSHYHVV